MCKFIILLSLIAVTYLEPASAASGSVELDEYTFDKVINKFNVSLIKFDDALPASDQHDSFTALAKEAKEIDELLVAEVGVKDHGEKDNEELAKKYGANIDNFPVVKLFVKGKEKPIAFDYSEAFTSDELRRFVKRNTGIYLSPPGCVREMDQLVKKFMKAKKDRKAVLDNVENAQKSLDDKDKASGKIYKAVMEKIMDKGDEFVNTEYERVKKLLLVKKISKKNKNELRIKLNILQTFQRHSIIQKNVKEEL